MRAVLIAIAPLPPPTGQKAAISRTAVFLCVFVVVHAIGNLTAARGQSAFNECTRLHRWRVAHPALRPPQVLTAAVLQTPKCFTAAKSSCSSSCTWARTLWGTLPWAYTSHSPTSLPVRTARRWDTLRGVRPRREPACSLAHLLRTCVLAGKSMGMDGGKFKPGAVQLIISGSVLTLFLVIHVKQFRLGQPEVSGDVYTLARQTLADPKMAAGYCAAVAALGFHLWKGWSSVIFSLKLDSQHSANALIIGQVVVRLCNCPSPLPPPPPAPGAYDRPVVKLSICVWGLPWWQCLSVCASCEFATNQYSPSAPSHFAFSSLSLRA